MQLTIIHTYMYVFILLCRLCVIVKFFIISNHMYIYIYIIHMYIWICIYIYTWISYNPFFPSAPSMNKSCASLHSNLTWRCSSKMDTSGEPQEPLHRVSFAAPNGRTWMVDGFLGKCHWNRWWLGVPPFSESSKYGDSTKIVSILA